MPPKPDNIFPYQKDFESLQGLKEHQLTNNQKHENNSNTGASPTPPCLHFPERSSSLGATSQMDFPSTPQTTMEAILGPETELEKRGREVREKQRTDMEERFRKDQSVKHSKGNGLRKPVAHLSAMPAPLFNGAFRTLRGWFSRKPQDQAKDANQSNSLGTSHDLAAANQGRDGPGFLSATDVNTQQDENIHQTPQSKHSEKFLSKGNRNLRIYCPPFESITALPAVPGPNRHVSAQSTNTYATHPSQYLAPIPKQGMIFANTSLSPMANGGYASSGMPTFVQRDSMNSMAGVIVDKELPPPPPLTASSTHGSSLNIPHTDEDAAEVTVQHLIDYVKSCDQASKFPSSSDDRIVPNNTSDQSTQHKQRLRRISSVPNLAFDSLFRASQADAEEDARDSKSLNEAKGTKVPNVSQDCSNADHGEKTGKESRKPESDSVKAPNSSQDLAASIRESVDVCQHHYNENKDARLSQLRQHIDKALEELKLDFKDHAQPKTELSNENQNNVSAAQQSHTLDINTAQVDPLNLSSTAETTKNSTSSSNNQTKPSSVEDNNNNENKMSDLFLRDLQAILLAFVEEIRDKIRTCFMGVDMTLDQFLTFNREFSGEIAARAVVKKAELYQEQFDKQQAAIQSYKVDLYQGMQICLRSTEAKLRMEMRDEIRAMEKRLAANQARIEAKIDALTAAVASANNNKNQPILHGALTAMPPHIPWGSRAVGAPKPGDKPESKAEETL